MGKQIKWLFIFITVTTLLVLQSCSKKKSTEPPAQVPTLTTADITEITQTTAVCGGTVTSDGGASVYFRGVCWSTNPTPTYSDIKTYDGTGTGTFTSSLTDLTAGTHYYVRAYAMNDAGLGYGDVDSFATAEESTTGTVTDIDGNIYATIKIGSQWWMAENLEVTHYRNGTALPNITDNISWGGLITGAYCNNQNDTANAAIYGRLFNWYAVNDSRNIAPAGSHVPTNAEWQTLIDYLGGEWVAGGKMKEAGITHWINPNADATNESGFSALPGGIRTDLGYYGGIGYQALFWSITEYDSDNALSLELAYDFAAALREYDPKTCGFSVRCVKD